MSSSGRLLPAAELACWVVLLLAGPRMILGQGLSATAEQLGANAAATATEFDTFEDLLSLSTTGGRGRGGRSGSGNLGSSFRETRDFEQLQTSMYYIGGSPPVYNSFNRSQTPNGLNYVPEPREQGACNSCVGQAVAAAIQMSLAYTTRQPIDRFNVSALALYYCVPGGRTCKTGWDIQASLRSTEVTPQWMLPNKCFESALRSNPAGSAEPDISNFRPICTDAAAGSKDPECRGVTAQQPRYNCSFKSLSSFWQVQQHIRTHGAVITRIAIYDDFNVQFNASARNLTSHELPPYRRNNTARLQYGHAAVIVGYNNTDFTWTILNSWGSGLDPNPRITEGITADGMFKIRMGVAGVGTPDLTYGVECQPAAGSVDNLHTNEPWLGETRLPLQPVNAGNRTCFDYTMKPNDTFASVADHFDVDIRTLVTLNLRLFEVTKEMKYKYQTILRLDEMLQTLDVVQKVTQDLLGTPTAPIAGGGAIEPYFVCTYFDAAGKGTQIKCARATLHTNSTICTRNGTVACTLFYSDVNVTQPAPNSRIRMCKSSWADTREFNKVAFEVGTGTGKPIPEIQEVALRRVLQTIDAGMPDAEASRYIICSQSEQDTDWAVRETHTTPRGITFSLAIACWRDQGAPLRKVIGLYFRVIRTRSGVTPCMHPSLSEQLVTALLDLPLEWLYITVYGGQVYPQLGALPLGYFLVNHYCMTGTLPPNLLYGWRNIGLFWLTRQGDAIDFNDPSIGICGISGPVPQQWQNTTRPDITNTRLSNSIYDVDLSGNLLSGSLPAIIGGPDAIHTLRSLNLRNNKFTGRVPDSWARLDPLRRNNNGAFVGPDVMRVIDIQQNQLAGPLPVTLSRLERRLEYLYVDRNPQLSGCVPLSPYTEATFDGTRVTGRCADSSARDIAHTQQRNAVNAHFLPSLSVNVNKEFRTMLQLVVSEINQTLGSSVQSGQTSKIFQQNNAQGEQRGFCKVSVTLIDGIEYITGIEVGVMDNRFPAAGLNMQRLLHLMQQLPRMRSFECSYCYMAAEPPPDLKIRLPPALPTVAPNLVKLGLFSSGIYGTIPASYGNFAEMQELLLAGNRLSGQLPAELSNLQKLKVLTLMDNRFVSTLPAAWSTMPKELYVGVASNGRITGNIPAQFASNTGTYFDLGRTSIGGCVPRRLNGFFGTFQTLPNGTRVLQDLPLC